LNFGAAIDVECSGRLSLRDGTSSFGGRLFIVQRARQRPKTQSPTVRVRQRRPAAVFT